VLRERVGERRVLLVLVHVRETTRTGRGRYELSEQGEWLLDSARAHLAALKQESSDLVITSAATRALHRLSAFERGRGPADGALEKAAVRELHEAGAALTVAARYL
jgi:hypothetical protein